MQYKYVALSSDPFACLRLNELPIGTKTGVLHSLSDEDPDKALKRVILFSVPEHTSMPGRHLRIVKGGERDQPIQAPLGVREGDILVAVKMCSSKKHREHLPKAMKSLHVTITGQRPSRKRRHRPTSDSWRRECAIMG